MNVLTATADSRSSLPVDLADPASMTAAARGVYTPGLQKAMSRLAHNYNRVQSPKAGISGIGNFNWDALNQAIQTGAQTVLPIYVAQNPGMVYTQSPNGQIMIYNAGAGGQMPGYYPVGSGGVPVGQPGVYNPGAGGMVAANTPVGNVLATDIDWGMIAMVGGGLLLVMMTMGRR